MRSVLRYRGVEINAKKCQYEGVFLSEVKVNVLEMKLLGNLVGVSRMDGVKNEGVCRRAGIERELVSGVDQRVLRCYGHVERMDEFRVARRMLMAEASAVRVQPNYLRNKFRKLQWI